MIDREKELIAEFLLRLRSRGINDLRLYELAETVPRRLFLPAAAENPFADEVWPIDCGQTMPSAAEALSLIALLDVEPTHRVLEVGTGSGYVTALLARLCVHVTSLERYARLLSAAQARLRKLSISNVSLLQHDGREGFASGGPYDRILVHGVLERDPKDVFLAQLAVNGLLLAGREDPDGRQMLTRARRVGNRLESEDLRPVFWQKLAPGCAAVL